MGELFERRPSQHDREPKPQFKGRSRKPKAATDPIDRERARRLRLLAASHNWPNRTGPTLWEEPLAILRRSLGARHVDIDTYLDWYRDWYRPGKKPELRNGKAFQKYWGLLCELYEKYRQVEISDEARQIATELKSSNPKLLVALQRSISNYNAFREKLAQILSKHADTQERESKTDWIAVALKVALTGNDLPDAEYFVLNWFHWFVTNRPDYRGDYSFMVISEANDNFMNRVKDVLGDMAEPILKECCP